MLHTGQCGHTRRYTTTPGEKHVPHGLPVAILASSHTRQVVVARHSAAKKVPSCKHMLLSKNLLRTPVQAGTLVPQQAVHHRLTAATYTLQMLATRAPKPPARCMPSSEDAALHKPITPLHTCRHHSQDPSNTSEVRMCGDIAKMVTRTAFKRSKC